MNTLAIATFHHLLLILKLQSHQQLVDSLRLIRDIVHCCLDLLLCHPNLFVSASYVILYFGKGGLQSLCIRDALLKLGTCHLLSTNLRHYMVSIRIQL